MIGMRPALPRRERGAALVAVLALVLLLASLVSLGLQRLKAATDRLVEAESRAAAQLLANAGTSAAASVVSQLKAAAHVQPTALERPITLAIAGGEVTLRFRDAGACFNLNSMAPPLPVNGQPPGEPKAGPEDLSRLLQAVGMPLFEADRIARATAARLATTGLLWADPSEWLGVPGVTMSVWQAAGPLLCAQPSRDASPINVNRLSVDQAPLLVAMGLDMDEARRAIAARPRRGWTSANDFWQQASRAGTPQSESAQMSGVSSRWLALTLVARTDGATVERQMLLDTQRQPALVVASEWKSPGEWKSAGARP